MILKEPFSIPTMPEHFSKKTSSPRAGFKPFGANAGKSKKSAPQKDKSFAAQSAFQKSRPKNHSPNRPLSDDAPTRRGGAGRFEGAARSDRPQRPTYAKKAQWGVRGEGSTERSFDRHDSAQRDGGFPGSHKQAAHRGGNLPRHSFGRDGFERAGFQRPAEDRRAERRDSRSSGSEQRTRPFSRDAAQQPHSPHRPDRNREHNRERSAERGGFERRSFEPAATWRNGERPPRTEREGFATPRSRSADAPSKKGFVKGGKGAAFTQESGGFGKGRGLGTAAAKTFKKRDGLGSDRGGFDAKQRPERRRFPAVREGEFVGSGGIRSYHAPSRLGGKAAPIPVIRAETALSNEQHERAERRERPSRRERSAAHAHDSTRHAVVSIEDAQVLDMKEFVAQNATAPAPIAASDEPLFLQPAPEAPHTHWDEQQG